VAAAAGTFILAGLAYSQVREMRAARIAQERPQVIVDVDHSKPPLVNVVLRNIGQGAAKDITFDFSAPMEIPEGANNPRVVPVNEQGYFKRGLDFLAPGAELYYAVGVDADPGTVSAGARARGRGNSHQPLQIPHG
jgi:hypothetical protein